MKSNEVLNARVSALENLIGVLILSRAVAWKKPSDEINRIFSIAYEINMQRLDVSKSEPERDSASKTFASIDRMFELIAQFGNGTDPDIEL